MRLFCGFDYQASKDTQGARFAVYPPWPCSGGCASRNPPKELPRYRLPAGLFVGAKRCPASKPSLDASILEFDLAIGTWLRFASAICSLEGCRISLLVSSDAKPKCKPPAWRFFLCLSPLAQPIKYYLNHNFIVFLPPFFCVGLASNSFYFNVLHHRRWCVMCMAVDHRF